MQDQFCVAIKEALSQPYAGTSVVASWCRAYSEVLCDGEVSGCHRCTGCYGTLF